MLEDMQKDDASAILLPVELKLATIEHLEALGADRALLGRLLKSSVPDGWPEFPEARGRSTTCWTS